MNAPRSFKAPDFLDIDPRGPNPDYHVADMQPFILDGVRYLQAGECGINVAHSANGGDISMMTMALGPVGLAAPMTTSIARAWAAQLIKVADELEAKAASQAADGIKRAAQGGAA